MRSQSVALILVGLMLFAPALGFTEKTQLEAEFEPQNAARSTANALLWGAHASGSGSTDSVMSIEMDAQGRTYVCGYFYNTAVFGNTTLSSSGSYDVFVGRLSNGAWDWVQRAGGSSSDQCRDIAVDDGGNVTITGYYYSSNSATFGGDGDGTRVRHSARVFVVAQSSNQID